MRVAIVGGGILGMELARQLQAAERQVTLYEATPYFGGLADAWQIGDLTWDRHYHVTLMSDLRLRALLDQLNLSDRLHWVETKTGFYTDGKLYSMSNTLEFLKFPPLGLLSKLRLGGTIFYASKIKNWQKLEAIPVVDWLRKWSGRRTTEKIWLPLLRAKLGENYQYASAAFIWAIIARMYAARKSGLKKEMFGYVRGGYASILDRFTGRLQEMGVSLRPGTKIESIQHVDGKFEIDSAQYDQVIVTTAAPIAAKLCPTVPAVERDALQAPLYQGIVCVSLVLTKPLAHYYVTNITEPAPFTAVIEMTALVDPVEFGGKHLIYLPKYVAVDDPLLTADDHTIRESFVAALERMYPHFSRTDVEAFRVSRVKHVLAISTLNYSQRLPPMVSSVPGLFFVNSAQIAQGTLNVNETLLLADRGAKAVLG